VFIHGKGDTTALPVYHSQNRSLKMGTFDSTNGDFAGLTTAQVKTVLSAIATQALTISQVCSAHAMEHDADEMGNVFRTLEMMVSTLGSLADRPLGGGCVGDVAAWHCGPNFATVEHYR
jgi:hypothetical protein